ncbi:phosphatase PAP2 family protein [Thiohalocapsa marina]|uniref:Phosphatase PAP2 family protein n=2 Tax=Thiohalocapsa marina TaxID=424902 RepID=A0A5M8FNR9_9GAMM|nr:phosphatase PAP2 family protein [Thiohalocapsa marina]
MLAFPQIDLALSGLFYTPGAGFTLRGQAWEQLLYHSVPVLMVTVNLGLIGLWLFNRVKGRALLGFDGRRLVLLLCLLALLPGLLVNQVFKEHWGRARPVQVTEFGGQRTFTPPFVRSDQRGGAFSSGHAAAAFYLIGVAAVLSGPHSGWVLLATLYALLVGLARIAAGGHFVSDVVTSGFLVLFGYLVLHHLLLGAGNRVADAAGTVRGRPR